MLRQVYQCLEDVLPDLPREEVRYRSDMGRGNHVIQCKQWTVVVDGLLFEYIQARSRDPPFAQCPNERCFFHDGPSGCVDQNRV